ncbi:DUF1326 domain-containing protein [Streptomyces sp. B3I8]|jgi:hypothetical protein|uniref:DUF1326 domain-containing protein n=1 Tax=Streptomyces sp. B3I8 TaxID=3042303 RepID=UPI002786372B|nr:DUF1326 domain-containing protein [Streptomyces sp. B3I8]MDQ0787763.1 hypothetical protein [Streptomyces sp. B3I8]
MTYSISGHYIAGCSCAVICGCPVDAQPRDARGGTECRGTAVFHIADGRLDEVDLSGVDFAFYNLFPSNLTAGDWKVGVVIDTAASDAQADAVGRILSGQEGGPFGELAQFIGEFLGTERGAVSLSGGEQRGLSVEGHTQLTYEPLRGADGTPTTVTNAMFGFAPEYGIGKATGSSDAFGLSYEPSYGEEADFVFASEQEAGAPMARA